MFLIDTGADISICKAHLIENDERICEAKITLTSITQDEVHSISLTNLKFNIYEKYFSNNFHLVDKDFAIQSSGILGRDFLQK